MVCRRLAGQFIECSRGRRVCDPHGVQLGLATLPGGDHMICHDACAEAILEIMADATSVVPEPRRLFASVMPPRRLLAPGRPPEVVPDARATLALPRDVTQRRVPPGSTQPARPRTGVLHREWVFAM